MAICIRLKGVDYISYILNMKCVFCCVFYQDKYVDMFYLLLESIFIYGKLDNTTKILVYTSTQMMNRIKQSHLYNEANMLFEINDTYNSIDKACKARLDLFQLPSVRQFETILYLDTDILVKGDLDRVFTVCEKDLLYVLEEGDIDDDHDYYGKSLFGEDAISSYRDTSAFTSGIMLFRNCDTIKELFRQINTVMVNRPYANSFYDQPYIVYTAFKYNLYDNKVLKTLVVNNDSNIHSNKVIHHFPGGPGIYQHKLIQLSTFLTNSKDFIITHHIEQTKQFINRHLLPIVEQSGEPLEGNIFMIHHTTTYTDLFQNKAKNICNLALNGNVNRVAEIGFNSGFSTLLMLMANPTLHVTCFDLGEHVYTLPCYLKIKETFGERIHLVIGDSTKTLANVDGTYDLIHIDGGHTTEVANSDIIHSLRLSRRGTVLIMDDYDFENLHQLWNNYVDTYNLSILDIFTYTSPHHDIRYVPR